MNSENLFLVYTLSGHKEYLFTKEKFLKFCNNQKGQGWLFKIGTVDSSIPFRNPNKFSDDEILRIFTLEELKPLLNYKEVKFGTQIIANMPFFSENFYRKYGIKK